MHAFDYHRPTSLADAKALYATLEDPMYVSGGMTLIPSMKQRLAAPSDLIDLSSLSELQGIAQLNDAHGATLRVGGLTRHNEVADSALIQQHMPVLGQVAAAIGDNQVRNRGTVLGNVCWADPRANLCVALLASGATVLVAGTEQETISIEDFFLGYRRNALSGRLAGSIRLTRHAQAIGCYQEFSRQTQDLALCNVCVVHNERGTAIAIGGIHQQPVRLGNLERILSKPDSTIKNLNSDIVASLDEMSLTPIIDHHGTPEFKLDVAATLIERAINQCMRGGDHV